MSARAAVERFLFALESVADAHIFLAVAEADALFALAETVDAQPDEQVPLRGTTFAVKDNIDVAGLPTSAACASFTVEPSESATVVQRLLDAGAIPVAKTNLDQFATGLVGTRSPFGVPTNPLDPTLVPGGSSSGSAVAVALDLVDFSLGTDTAGSGRVPAAFCGIVGLKPTPGRFPTTGVVPAVRSADVVSIFSRTVALGQEVARHAAGPDGVDPFAQPAPVERPVRAQGRLGAIDEADLSAAGATRPVIEAYQRVVERLMADHGYEVTSIPVDGLFAAGDLLYGDAFVAERTWAVGDVVAAHPDAVDPTVGAIIANGARFDAVAAHDAAYRIAELRLEIERWITEVDFFVTPTVPRLVSLAEISDDPVGPNTLLGRFTTFANLLDLAAVTVPGADETAVGSVTFYGTAWTDDQLAEVAAALLNEPIESAVPDGWFPLVVAGAHLKGQPLASQLEGLGARWGETTHTAPTYRLFALPGGPPFKPALMYDVAGATIEVDVWYVSPAALGTFLTLIPAPLALGTVTLADGRHVTGFVAEPRASVGATEITHLGGWRTFVLAQEPTMAP